MRCVLAHNLLVLRVQPFLMPTWPRRLIDEIERRGLFFVELAGDFWLGGPSNYSRHASFPIAGCESWGCGLRCPHLASHCIHWGYYVWRALGSLSAIRGLNSLGPQSAPGAPCFILVGLIAFDVGPRLCPTTAYQRLVYVCFPQIAGGDHLPLGCPRFTPSQYALFKR